MAREDLLAQTFVQLADSLVADFDIIDLLTVLSDRCIELFDVEAAGILLVDLEGKLRVMAASTEQTRLLELFQLQNEEGPCLEAYSTGRPVSHDDLRAAEERWPRFAPEALAAGFQSVSALPLRLRASVIGALNLFRSQPGALPDSDIRLAQAWADVASIAIIQDQANTVLHLRDGQLQHALDSRVVIEQAKGMLAAHASIDMAEAFHRLRTFARASNSQLTEVANDLVSGARSLDEITVKAPGPHLSTPS